MSYKNIQRLDYPRHVDLGANSPVVWIPADDMIVYGFGLKVTEAVHTATVTTAATVTFAYDAANAGTTAVKGTVSIGLEGILHYEESDVSMTPFKVDASAGDALEWTLTTVISATTTTGVSQPFIYAEVFPPLVGA